MIEAQPDYAALFPLRVGKPVGSFCLDQVPTPQDCGVLPSNLTFLARLSPVKGRKGEVLAW